MAYAANSPPPSGPTSIKVSGIEPPDATWKQAPESERRAFWQRAGEIAVDVKRKSLARGLDRFGRRLKPIKARRPDGAKGPPLTPHAAGSRTRRLLAFAVAKAHLTLYWRSGWGKILGYHAEGAGHLPVRDVIGLSKADERTIRDRAWTWWRARQRGRATPPLPAIPAAVAVPGTPTVAPKPRKRRFKSSVSVHFH